MDSRSLVFFEMTGEEIYGLADPKRLNRVDKKSALGARRIHRASDKEEIIAALVAGKVGVFREIWRLLLFAAQVGFKNRRREPLSSIDSGKGIDQSTFGNCPAWPGILYLVALVESDSSDVLSSSSDREEERITAFQEYANGGLALLAEFFKDRICDLDGLLAFIDTQISRSDLKTDLGFTI